MAGFSHPLGQILPRLACADEMAFAFASPFLTYVPRNEPGAFVWFRDTRLFRCAYQPAASDTLEDSRRYALPGPMMNTGTKPAWQQASRHPLALAPFYFVQKQV